TVVAAQVTDADTSDPPDQLAADYVFSFSTDAAPTVMSTTPTNGVANTGADTNITIIFSEPVNVTGSAFTLECPTGTSIPFTKLTGAGPATHFTFYPQSTL